MVKVKDMMTKNVVTVGPADSVKTAVELMNKNQIMGLVVIDDARKPLGVLSDRSLVRRFLPKNIPPDKGKVADFMLAPALTVKPQDDVKKAAKIITSNNLSRLPVIDDGKLVGVITLTDIAKHLTKPGLLPFLSERWGEPKEAKVVCPNCHSGRLRQVEEAYGPVWKCPKCQYVLD